MEEFGYLTNKEIKILKDDLKEQGFDMSKLKVKVTIVSSNMSEELIKKYNKQYNNLRIIENNLFHDRFIIIDKAKLYVSGASLKDLGEKCFAITKIEDENIIKNILKIIKED